MKKLKIYSQGLGAIWSKLCQDYQIFAPVRKVNKGRFSDTDLVTYNFIQSFTEIEFSAKTYYSAKEVLFPVRQSLFEFKDGKSREAEENFPPTIVFLRACDIHAIGVMDKHFLKGSFADVYYKRRREKLTFFLMECALPFEDCFCVSLGANRSENYAVFLRPAADGWEVKIKDSQMEKYFTGGIEAEIEPRFVEQDEHPVSIPQDLDASIFTHPMWQEYSRRCIGCGRCNSACPTCTCFTLQDILLENKRDSGSRTRIWSSCQVKKFSLLAGNHDFRLPFGDRMRYKVLHKISDFKKKTGVNMCVGCGRCDTACPEYISMFKSIEKINAVIEEQNKDG